MIRAIDRDLWCVDAKLRLGGGFQMPVRMTVIRLADGGLWIHSPVAMDDETIAEIDQLGPVHHIVAPNLLHHLFARPACERWPAAKLHATPGLAHKRPNLTITDPLAEDSRWANEIEIVAIAGARKIDEFVFVHRSSGTLILTDLLFNIQEVEGAMTSLFLRMVGARKRLAQSRVWRVGVADRAAFKASGERMLGHEFHRLVPAHGEVIEGSDTRERVRAALHWMLA